MLVDDMLALKQSKHYFPIVSAVSVSVNQLNLMKLYARCGYTKTIQCKSMVWKYPSLKSTAYYFLRY